MNGYYFDEQKQRFRVQVVATVNGKRIRRSRLMPAASTQQDAAELAQAIKAGAVLDAAGVNRQFNWESEIDRVCEARKSWFHEILRRAKQRARNKGVPFDLTASELRAVCLRSRGRCEVSGVPFSDETTNRSKMRPFVPSIDRRNPVEGYTIANVRLVCSCINVAMFSWGEEAFKRLAVGYVINQFMGQYTDLILRPESKPIPTEKS